VSDFSGYLGAYAGSDGVATVSGSGSSWTNTNNFIVGYSGTGTLTVSSVGAVSDVSGYIGYGTGSTGTATVSGSGSSWSTAGSLTVGYLGSGTLIVENGGLVGVTGATTIGSAGALELDGGSTFRTGSLAINGGALVTLGAATFAPSANLGAGGVRINTDGFNSTLAGNFSGTGGITKVGSGVATLTGASTYTGTTSINAGTLALTTASAHTASLGNTAIKVASGATFAANLGASPFSKVVNAGTTGSGSAGATLTLNPGSTFSMAGASLATFNLEQESSFSGPAFTIGGASGIAPSLIFDIGNAATGTDLLNVTKTVSVLATGGDITIDALAGDSSLTAGNYDLITSAGGFSGTGGNGLALSGTTLAISGTTYDLSLTHSTADDEILTVSASTPSAPESSRGGTDAVAFELGGATPHGVDDRLQTAAHGYNAVAPLVATASVPEPGTTASLLSAFGIAGAWMVRRRRERNRGIPL
jgi:T5SS/PEP-CTERM-associated repeat protein/autotransporter-associated beta strand protein